MYRRDGARDAEAGRKGLPLWLVEVGEVEAEEGCSGVGGKRRCEALHPVGV